MNYLMHFFRQRRNIPRTAVAPQPVANASTTTEQLAAIPAPTIVVDKPRWGAMIQNVHPYRAGCSVCGRSRGGGI
jgi:hypothetical protein